MPIREKFSSVMQLPGKAERLGIISIVLSIVAVVLAIGVALRVTYSAN